ncbi:hypothetical protein AYK24_03800 [Thermoplasmatales archaeon SG8-52-4]|nr:MAG: hypothetical protein AYK24_03800 [Thermoplasmatales archaeon SG8-52-4]
MKKLLAVFVTLLFFGMIIFPSSGIQIDNKPIIKSDGGNILYVGGNGSGNYSKIQDAIDNASDGDTVFVFDDSSPYYENVVINKTINLIGECKDTTIIDGMGKGNVVWLKEYNYGVTICGFTIQKGGVSLYRGILIENSDSITITDNIIVSSTWCGIGVSYSDNCIISSNNVSYNNNYGISLAYSNNNIISDNTLSYHENSLSLGCSNNNFIFNNTFLEGNNCMNIQHCNCNTVKENKIYNGKIHIYNSNFNNIINNSINAGLPFLKVFLSNCTKNNITGNSFFNTGLWLYYSYLNNVSDNTVNDKPLVYLEEKSYESIDNDNVGQVVIIKCNNIVVKNLTISNTYIGIQLFDSNNCSISDNIISNSCAGIQLDLFNNSDILNNSFLKNKHGILFYHFNCNNTISRNNLYKNLVTGIVIDRCSDDNILYLNNFIDNTEQARDNRNIWDNGKSGNYWDDYNGTDDDGDGIGDTPYLIPGGSKDIYPLMYPTVNFAPTAPIITGPKSGKPKVEYEYTFNSTDPNNDSVKYFIDWGDNNTEWTEYGDSGLEISLEHTWYEKGNYTIKAKAKDINGSESNWSEFIVTMPRDKSISRLLFLRFLERYPLIKTLLLRLGFQ